jgi:hypothetical protein
MSDAVMTQSSEVPAEEALRTGLVDGDRAIGSIGPVIGHLLASRQHSLFSDEILSRVRGMVSDLARQLVIAEDIGASRQEDQRSREVDLASLIDKLMADARLVSHCHALAIEGQLCNRLERDSAIDPVLSPLIQSLIASDDTATASTAMAALASQARFLQSQRRMELPVSELPADLFDQILQVRSDETATETASLSQATIERLRGAYDESATRLALFSRLVAGMGAGARAALSIRHAGLGLFLSALSIASRYDRNLAVIASTDRQSARLALSLRAVGLKAQEIEEQFLYLHPEASLPANLDSLSADRASALLAVSGRTTVV